MRFVIVFTSSLLLFLPALQAQKEQDILQYIATYKDLAIREEQRTGVPASIKLAQGIHETQAGKSDLVLRSNNHFGIKCKSTWTGDKVFHDDDARGECFRRYTRAEDSYMDHSDFLKTNARYAFLFRLDPTDYQGWAYGLRQAGYATNIKYSQILISIIKNYNLGDYTLIALGKMRESDHVVSTPSIPAISRNQPVAMLPDLKDELPDEEPVYPAGEFSINGTRVIYAKENTDWLSIAEKYRISKSRLWDFNDLEVDDDVLVSGQLVFLQRKRKVGEKEFHVVKKGENIYTICQSEGIRYDNLLKLNHLTGEFNPAVGERLYLQSTAPGKPALVNETRQPVITNPGQVASTTAIPPRPVAQTPAEANPAPQFTMHTVEPKETLFSISKRFSVDIARLVQWNKLDSSGLKVGQMLIVARKD